MRPGLTRKALAWLRDHSLPVALLLGGLALRLVGIGHPDVVVWDEQHFGRFTQGYIQGRFFFDIHPPLGKLLLLVPLSLCGADPGDFHFVARTPYPPGYPYVAARLPAALIGGLLPLLVYLLARRLSLSERASFFAGALVLLDNAILTESRLVLIDMFVPVFSCTAFILFLAHRDAAAFSRRWWTLLVLSGLAAGCSVAVKWTGLGAAGVIGLVIGLDALRRREWRVAWARLACGLGTMAAVYVLAFAIHFALAHRSGTGDPYMTLRFRQWLAGAAPMSFPERFLELNQKMYQYNVNQPLTHHDSSQVHHWLVGQRPVAFWSKGDDSQSLKITLTANPVVWLLGGAALFGGIAFLVARRRALVKLAAADPAWKRRLFAFGFLYAVHFVNTLPFVFLGRAMFIYHYFTSMIATVILGALLVCDAAPAAGLAGPPPDEPLDTRYLYWGVLGLAAAAFLFRSPLTYGYRLF